MYSATDLDLVQLNRECPAVTSACGVPAGGEEHCLHDAPEHRTNAGCWLCAGCDQPRLVSPAAPFCVGCKWRSRERGLHPCLLFKLAGHHMLRGSLRFCPAACLRFAERYSGGITRLVHCACGSRWHGGVQVQDEPEEKNGYDAI